MVPGELARVNNLSFFNCGRLVKIVRWLKPHECPDIAPYTYGREGAWLVRTGDGKPIIEWVDPTLISAHFVEREYGRFVDEQLVPTSYLEECARLDAESAARFAAAEKAAGPTPADWPGQDLAPVLPQIPES